MKRKAKKPPDPTWDHMGIPDTPENRRRVAKAHREMADIHEVIAEAQEFDVCPPGQEGFIGPVEFCRTIWGLVAWPAPIPLVMDDDGGPD